MRYSYCNHENSQMMSALKTFDSVAYIRSMTKVAAKT